MLLDIAKPSEAAKRMATLRPMGILVPIAGSSDSFPGPFSYHPLSNSPPSKGARKSPRQVGVRACPEPSEGMGVKGRVLKVNPR